MTDKQKWFINKLMTELGKQDYASITLYGQNGFDSYRTSVSEASKDIDMLLSAKTIGLEAAYQLRISKMVGQA